MNADYAALDAEIDARGGPLKVVTRRVLDEDEREAAYATFFNTPLPDGDDPRQEPPPEETARPPKAFKLIGINEVLAMPPMRWLIHGLLPEEGYGCLYGPSGAGKGFLVVNLIKAIDSGKPWFGHPVRVPHGRVLYVVLEGKQGVPKRFTAEVAVNGPFSERLQFLFESFRLTEPGDVIGLAATIDAVGGADLIVIDTLNRAAPGFDENSPKDMGQILEAVKELQSLTGGMVLLVHHTGKDASKGMRGHSSLFAGMDGAIEVTRSGDVRSWVSDKVKDEQDGAKHAFSLRRVHLGEDEYGDAITSCVIDISNAEEPPTVARAPLPRGGNQKIVYDALGPHFRAAHTFGKAGAPAHRPCLHLNDAVSGVRDRLLVDDKRRTERALEAIKGLVAKGTLCCNEEWIWLA